MKQIELVRWGLPTAAFLGYVKWGGPALALILFGIVFAITSAFIHWHRKDPRGFFVGMRAWIIVLLVVPCVLLTIGAALTVPILMPLALIPLGISIWLLMRNNKKIQSFGA
jgi:CHASE2 domain-containing sensor protein